MSVLIDRGDESDSVESMHISLDEIMRREKFTAEEKALVEYAGQTAAERIKVITDIKIAKSNDRYSQKIAFLTCLLALTALLDLLMPLTADPKMPFIPAMAISVIILVIIVVTGSMVAFR